MAFISASRSTSAAFLAASLSTMAALSWASLWSCSALSWASLSILAASSSAALLAASSSALRSSSSAFLCSAFFLSIALSSAASSSALRSSSAASSASMRALSSSSSLFSRASLSRRSLSFLRASLSASACFLSASFWASSAFLAASSAAAALSWASFSTSATFAFRSFCISAAFFFASISAFATLSLTSFSISEAFLLASLSILIALFLAISSSGVSRYTSTSTAHWKYTVALPSLMSPTYSVVSVVSPLSLNSSLNSRLPLELAFFDFMLNLVPFSSDDISVKSQSSLGVMLETWMISWLLAKEPFLIPLTGIRTYGSSYSPVPPCHPNSVVVYSGSGPSISSSLTVKGLITHRSRSSSRRIGKQQIQRILTASGTYTSKRLQTPSPSSSSGTDRLSFGFVPQLVSLRSSQPSLSSSRSSTSSNVQLAESVRYLQVNSSGMVSLSVSSHAVGSFGNLSIGSPMLSPSSSSSM